MATYTVVENSGMENECDVEGGFPTARGAYAYIEKVYTEDEVESLTVRVRKDFDGLETYEF